MVMDGPLLISSLASNHFSWSEANFDFRINVVFGPQIEKNHKNNNGTI